MNTMREIPLTGPDGEVLSLLVDDEDYEFMSRFPWRAKKDGEDRYYAYATIVAHKVLVDYKLVDHVNGDALDNTRTNLRSATHQQNSWNRGLRSDSKTGYKGVRHIADRNAFGARIQVDGKRRYLGYFKNPVDAAKAYDAAAREHFGEFARLNFPEQGGDA
jgi:hypothetical protein